MDPVACERILELDFNFPRVTWTTKVEVSLQFADVGIFQWSPCCAWGLPADQGLGPVGPLELISAWSGLALGSPWQLPPADGVLWGEGRTGRLLVLTV